MTETAHGSPGTYLPPLPESAYPPGAQPLDPADPWSQPATVIHPYPVPPQPLQSEPQGHAAVGAALLGAGVSLPFADGVERILRYDFYSMLVIEEEYGSIKALLDRVEPPKREPGTEPGKFDSLGTPIMSVCADLIRFGLYDESTGRHLTKKEVARLLVPARLGDYVEVAARSIAQAFGPTAPPSKDGGPPGDPTTGSTGSAGGASPHGTVSSTGSGA